MPVQTLEGPDLADHRTKLFAAFRHRVPNELVSVLASEEEGSSVSGEGPYLLETSGAIRPPGRPRSWAVRGEYYDRHDPWQRFEMAGKGPTGDAARETVLSSRGSCHGVKRRRIRLFPVAPRARRTDST